MCSRRTSWISVRYQTLCLGVACLLFMLYKYFPTLFSLILNSYPLIICTTIFLGILSRYRKPDAPKKEDDRKTRRSSSLKIQSVENSLRAKKEESFKLKAHVGSRRTFKKMPIRTIVSGDTIHNAPSKGIEDNQVNQIDAANVASSSSVDRKSLTEDEEHSKERLGEGLQTASEHIGPPAYSGEKNITVLDVDADKTKLDQYIDSCLGSPWYHVDHQDPSVVNATPILGELDPHISKGISDDNSVSFSQNHVMDEGTEAENQDDKGAQEEKDDGNKFGVTWSADDKRKLMDLGDSEVERNRRLENLIARRRARKAMEKNIIDLDNNMETSESHGQLPPISINAPRRNLFGLPYDLDESIPGSAPSILLPRRNPFDLPYEQVDDEENCGRNEFVTIPQREILFRRHESFTIGASLFFGGFEQDWYSSRFRSCVGEEKNEPQDTVHADLRGLLGEVSDSEMNSTLESDSVSSVANQEHQKDLCGESESPVKHQVGHSEQDSQSSEDTDSMNAEQIVCQMNLTNDHETQFTEHINRATEDSATESNWEREEGLCQESDFPKMHKVKPDERVGKSSKDAESMDVEQVECQMNMKNDHETQLSTEHIHQNTEDYGAECDREHQKDLCQENDSPEKYKEKPTEQDSRPSEDVGQVECQMNVNNDHGAHLFKDIYQATADFGAESNQEHQQDLHQESEPPRMHKAKPAEQDSKSSKDIESVDIKQVESQTNINNDHHETHLSTEHFHQETEDFGAESNQEHQKESHRESESPKKCKAEPTEQGSQFSEDTEPVGFEPVECQMNMNNDHETHLSSKHIHQYAVNSGAESIQEHQTNLGPDSESPKKHKAEPAEQASQSSVDVEKVKCQMNMNTDNVTHSSTKQIHQATEDFGAESNHEHQKDLHLESESFKTHKAEPDEQGSQSSEDIEQLECQMNMIDDQGTHLMSKRIHQTTEDIGDVKGNINKKLISCSPISYAEREVADEKCESNSSISSEVERNSPKTSTHEQTVNIEQINHGSCRGLTVSTDSIAIGSDVANVESEKVHDSHVEESLSISSPTATRKSHSNSSVVDEKCKSSASIPSEAEKNSPKISTHEQTVDIEQINSGSCKGLTVLTESIAAGSDVGNVEAQKVHDSDAVESVSKSTPTTTRKSHSNSSVTDDKCEFRSSIPSEADTNSAKVSTHGQTVDIEQINNGSLEGLTVSPESISVDSDIVNVEAEKVDDSHIVDPVSNASPIATRESHSNSSVADEKCDSSSSIPSTAEKNSHKINTHEKTVGLEQINSGSCKGLTVFTESIAVDSDDVNVEAEKAHDSHIVEPISNSGPTATRKSHPDSSLVDEKCESNSSIPSESEKNSHQMSNHEQTVDIEQISSSYCKGLAILTESFAVDADVVNVEAEKIHDSHIMEPGSNSSPTATRKSHSNSLLDEAYHTADKEGSTYNQSLASGTDTSLSVVGSIMKTAETDELSGGKTEDILSLSFKDEDDSVSRGLSIIKESNVI
ncbi:hypothetical protein MUK42_03856 [Musa troglodytarum]|uniref:Cardiomyopathy-associated protein 5 n=1 Tax=Musa troglodytarum TaxID=320322 RepID=A0A9E7K9F4_9LILI|nr:hypothetical protein MUK42_03856 [Musa troglodytarum]